jgi:hypothetical protein
VNFKPLKKFFLASYAGSRSFLRANAAVDPLSVPLFRSVEDIKAKGEKFVLPNRATSLAKLVGQLQEACSTTTLGKFADALVIFKILLQAVVVSEESEISEVCFLF